MKSKTALFVPDADGIYFVALGGVGEIGMNMSLYGHDGQWLMVDCGVSFADEAHPGIEVLMPDPRFIADQTQRLCGLLITHGHEDHLGAVEHLWPRLRCPIYATPFTAELLRAKLAETPFLQKIKIIELPSGGAARVGPFDLELIPMTHSIPESQAVVLRTPVGSVLHTGDWKLDPKPLVGEVSKVSALQALGRQSLAALVGDSTNAMVPGRAGSESEVLQGLIEVFSSLRHRIAVTCFASNVARLHSITLAAQRSGRHVALVGRSLWRIWEVARETGYLRNLPEPLSDSEAAQAPRENIVLICTGSQGEPRSALARIAADTHPEIRLEEGDTCIFSSREIPGNEKAIHAVQNRLIKLGVRLITADDARVHVSGHPCRDELAEMYQWTRPALAVPVHGEPRHQMAHAELAKECQVADVMVPECGQVLRLTPHPSVVTSVHAGKLAKDGGVLRLLSHEGGAIRERQKMGFGGMLSAVILLDERGRLIEDPRVQAAGLTDGDEDSEWLNDITEKLGDFLDSMPKAMRQDDAMIQERSTQILRKAANEALGKKPVVHVHVVRA